MSSSKLPAGYHTVTPAIIVRDAAAAIDFYHRAFGAEEVNRMAGPDGKIMHAEIRIGDSLVMLGEENEQWGTKSPLITNGNPGSLHIYVDDADGRPVLGRPGGHAHRPVRPRLVDRLPPRGSDSR
jgi:uncharacterized glyoxalase superfamily protein PhnB